LNFLIGRLARLGEEHTGGYISYADYTAWITVPTTYMVHCILLGLHKLPAPPELAQEFLLVESKSLFFPVLGLFGQNRVCGPRVCVMRQK
jgi:hypothetical protein